MSRLAASVFATSPEGEGLWFGPDSKDLPKWVEKAVTNPKAWDEAPEEDPADTADFPEGKPEEAWKADQLKAYAASKEIDLSGASNKAEMVKAIEAADAPAS